ncbi:uncharacterized protein LOC127807860 [Diospyros lotus]|uniref:uncharacterized protein LOC127807860 n=1 Tax=Diospyros lotus TaxID=55363 RepID=UPI002250BEB4|nr:uncharacterized protein LOC127807860 [Diospyros lotus]
MAAVKSGAKKRVFESGTSKSEKRKQVVIEDDLDADLSSEIKGIVSALRLVREKAQKKGQKKNEESIWSIASEVKSRLDELQTKFEKDRKSLAKALSKSSKECENLLKNETSKFQAVHEKFCNERAAHLQALKDAISEHEEEKERLSIRYEQQRKKEKNMISEHEKTCANKIAELEASLKKKQDDKTFNVLRRTLGSFLETASEEYFLLDD